MSMREPPYSLEAEQAVIGSILSDPSRIDDCAMLVPEDFYHHKHRELWRIIKSQEYLDMTAVMMAVDDRELMVYAGDLLRSNGFISSLSRYAKVIRDRAISRRLIAETMNFIGNLYDAENATEAVQQFVRGVDAIGAGGIIGAGPRHVGEVAAQWHQTYKQRTDRSGPIGLQTGFPTLDRRLGGLRGGQLVVVSGRPGTGKTTLAMNIAEHIANDHPVAAFQMEMSDVQVIDRAVASLGSIDYGKIRSGAMLDQDEYDSLIHAVSRLKSSRMYLDTTPRQSVDYVRTHAKTFVKRHGPGCIVVDYLTLMKNDRAQKGWREDQVIGDMTRDMKLLAKETDSPVILLAQMNRDAEKSGRKPQLSDLKGSGAIEADADVIMFTHKDDPDQNFSEIVTRKHREGQIGTDYLLCEFDRSRFAETPSDWALPSKGKNQNGGFS